jgi:hypothetical protein
MLFTSFTLRDYTVIADPKLENQGADLSVDTAPGSSFTFAASYLNTQG